MKEWALYYAELGLAVFPLAYRNKVPAIEGGCKAATTEKSKIERWWNQNPRYNIGIATGNKSNGLVVIDLDVDKNKGIDGYEVLRDWQNKHGELPETWQSITGRGGYHYFYKDTITHSNKVGLYEGVDIRGEGGYIVAPPSVHPNGNTYEWEQEPKEYEIAQVDDIVNDFFKGEKQRIDSEHKTNFKVPELIPEGKRVDTIVRLIASLRTKGLDDDAIKAAVRVENEKRCNPPLKEKPSNGNCSISGHLIRWRTLSVRNLLKCGLKPEKQESLLEKQKPIQSRNLLSMQRDRAAAMQKCFI